MHRDVTISDDFDNPQGEWHHYDTYEASHRALLHDQAHVDIRSFQTDEGWTVGTVAKQTDRNHQWALTFNCVGGSTTTTSSVITIAGDVDAIDILTGFEDDDFISVALPAFPLPNVDLAQSWIDFTSNPTGNFTTGPTVSLRLDQSTVALINGDSEYRRLRSALAGIDIQHITGVRFRIRATTTTNVRASAIRLLSKNWAYTQIDQDTRLQILKPTVAPNGSPLTAYSWDIPTLFRAGAPANTSDPRPIDISVAVAFNAGQRTLPNVINLFFRENALDFTQMIDLNGKTMDELNGNPMPNYTDVSFRGRTQSELDRLTQDELDGITQYELERTPDPDLSSYMTAVLSWQGGATNIFLGNSNTNGYTFDEIDGLAIGQPYIFIVDVEDRSMRARLYPLDNAGNIVTGQLIFDTGGVFDTFNFVRRPGRFGWSVRLDDGDAFIDSIRTRRLVYGELQTQPFASITPVEGCELYSTFSPPLEYFEDLFVTDEPVTTATVTHDRERSTSGRSWRIDNPGIDVNQGIQTNLADFHDFNEIEISFDVYYPKAALDAGVNLIAYLDNDKGRTIELPLPGILPDRWQTVKINPGNPTAQTGRYRLFVVQDDDDLPTTWWIDNVHIHERTVSFYGRSVLEDPWGDARVDWIPFRNTINKQSSGVQFVQRGNHLQIMAKAHRQTSSIDSIKAIPRYAQLGRLVWEEDELHTPQQPVASFTATEDGLEVTFNGQGSTDADGEVINYQWAFGDGSTAVGPVVVYTYPRAGTYSPSLVVTDTNGLQSQATQTIFVTP